MWQHHSDTYTCSDDNLSSTESFEQFVLEFILVCEFLVIFISFLFCMIHTPIMHTTCCHQNDIFFFFFEINASIKKVMCIIHEESERISIFTHVWVINMVYYCLKNVIKLAHDDFICHIFVFTLLASFSFYELWFRFFIDIYHSYRCDFQFLQFFSCFA